LINHPRVLLLDEPLGALDLKLREQMQVELKALQRQIGITFIYVTHDQQEALSMSDRLAVFDGGRVEQLGPPNEIYEHPATPFVAGFVGSSNLVDADLAQRISGTAQGFTIRPERIRFVDPATMASESACIADGTVEDVQYLGATTRFDVTVAGGGRLTVMRQNAGDDGGGALRPGDRVRLAFERSAIHRMRASTAEA